MDAYESYDLQEEDPYPLENSTCLANLLGITNTADLTRAEADFCAIAIAQLIHDPITPAFDKSHLCAIHKHLFCDVYEWAGELRRTEISKGGILFLPYRYIDEVLAEIFSELRAENHLRGLPIKRFASRAAYYLGRLNMAHAFREGNGRTQRIFLDQLAALAGYTFVWQEVSGEKMAIACRSARQRKPDYSELERLLMLHIDYLSSF